MDSTPTMVKIKMKNSKRSKSISQTLKKKSVRKLKAKKIARRKQQSEDLEELVLTWNEDLCE